MSSRIAPYRRGGTRASLFLLAPLLIGVVACGQCTSCDVRSLEVDGDLPYVRCNELDPPEGEGKAGRLSFAIEGRTMTVDRSGAGLRMAVFRGPAPGRRSLKDLKKRFKGIDLVWVLGDLGDAEDTAVANLRALAESEALTLVLAGSRDDAEVLLDAFDELSDIERERVIDARGLSRVVVGEHRFDLLSGGRGGRYARTERGCGYSADDLEGRWDEAGEGPRTLISWMAPMGQALGGVYAGDAELGRRLEAGTFNAAVSAWPAQLDSARRWTAPRLDGPAVERGDGRRLTGFLSFELGGSGLKLVSSDGDADPVPEDGVAEDGATDEEVSP